MRSSLRITRTTTRRYASYFSRGFVFVLFLFTWREFLFLMVIFVCISSHVFCCFFHVCFFCLFHCAQGGVYEKEEEAMQRVVNDDEDDKEVIMDEKELLELAENERYIHVLHE